MTTYTDAQVQQLWIANGGPPTLAPLFSIISQLESGRDDTRINNNPSTGDYSVGLWQINYFGNLFAGRTAQFGSPSYLVGNPNAQAAAAVQIYQAQGLAAWSTAKAAQAELANQSLPGAHGRGASGSFGPGASTGVVQAQAQADGTAGAGAKTSASGDGCLVSIPSFFGFGGGCLISKREGTAILGGVEIIGGSAVLLVGVVLLMVVTIGGKAAAVIAPAAPVARLAGAVRRPAPAPAAPSGGATGGAA